ncbi:signal peptidase I [Chloroflexales bacterium ZM16-3]|nr:signal peptidase I [Chloroflexales bacterium ZM16-3]
MPRLIRRRKISVNAIEPIQPQRPRRLLAEALRTAIYMLVLLMISSTLVARYRIEQTSMEPNIHPGQRVIVSQAGRTIGSWFNRSAYAAHSTSAAAAGLQHGQIVIFYETDDLSQSPLIKRLIGLPGDTVAIHDGATYINNVRIPEPYLSVSTECSNYCNLTLDTNEYYFMGDNRSVSRDSRLFGPIPGDHVIGRVVLRFWPLDQMTLFP